MTDTRISTIQTPVLIVGAGPVGLSLANELGYQGVGYILVEQGDGKVRFPAGENIFSRTMEHLRRWGIAARLRHSDAFPPDFPRNMGFCTRIGGKPLAFFAGASNADAPGADPYSPEGGFFYPKKGFDPALRQAAQDAGGDLRYGWQLENFEQTGAGVECTIRELAGGKRHLIRCKYLAACDGGRSGIRKSAGLRFNGSFGEGANFAIYLRCPGLAARLDDMFGHPMAQVHTVCDENRGYLTSVNGKDEWRLSIYSETEKTHDPETVVRATIGGDLAFDVLQAQPWYGHRVVADSYRAGQVFLVGDAAHLRWPKGGFGANTGIGDAVDLGWKIAAVEAGWGGPGLLDSYDAERPPIAARNTNEASNNRVLDRMIAPDPALEQDGAAGNTARRRMTEKLFALRMREFVTPGVQLGYRYRNSPVCVPDGTLEGPDDHLVYFPTTRPGARAPHVPLKDGRSSLDLFGRGFTLVVTDPKAVTEPFLAAGRDMAIPVTEARRGEAALREIYETALVLVRPDGHVCWRGDALPDDMGAIWRIVTGH